MAEGSMTRAEREAFLADVHVGVLAIDEAGRGPMAVPIWYQYESGEVVMGIERDTLKDRLLRASERATLTVQTEVAPYKYVSVEGPVSLEPHSHDHLAMSTRYLGPELGKWYDDNNAPHEGSLTVRLRPEHWRTYDFGKLFE
jgi:nitroimidazol reductase NimA-like FMN-containing flavoprotein (pyridoxamine 5'-phosphate oxidase superfamily)